MDALDLDSRIRSADPAAHYARHADELDDAIARTSARARGVRRVQRRTGIGLAIAGALTITGGVASAAADGIPWPVVLAENVRAQYDVTLTDGTACTFALKVSAESWGPEVSEQLRHAQQVLSRLDPQGFADDEVAEGAEGLLAVAMAQNSPGDPAAARERYAYHQLLTDAVWAGLRSFPGTTTREISMVSVATRSECDGDA